MAYDLEEQEQIDTLKAFWNQYGNLITWILIVALASYAGYNFWKNHERTQAAEASSLYDELQKQLAGKEGAKDNAKVQRIATDVETKYASSVYAQMSALGAARSAFDANDLKTAKAQLQWVIDHGTDEYKSLAKLRLSGVLLDEKAYDQALTLLNGEFQPQFIGAVSDRKGDILVGQNKLVEARTAYLAAYTAMGERNPGRQLVQLKLESIGGSVPADPAAAAVAKAA